MSVSVDELGVLLSSDSPKVGIGRSALLLMTAVALYQTQGMHKPKAHGGGVRVLGGGAGVLDDAGIASSSLGPGWEVAVGAIATDVAGAGAAGADGALARWDVLGGGAAVAVCVAVGEGTGFAGLLAVSGLPVARTGSAAGAGEGAEQPAAKNTVAAAIAIAAVLPPRNFLIFVPLSDSGRFTIGPALRQIPARRARDPSPGDIPPQLVLAGLPGDFQR